MNTQPWSYRVEKDIDHIHNLHKIKFERRLPGDLSNILFDVANNLRSVLDQVGYAAAKASGNTRLKATKFPFGPNEIKWRQNLTGGCKDLPAEIRTLFGSFKSYKGGNDTLWALNELCNTSKHISLVPIRVIHGPMVWVRFGENPSPPPIFPVRWDPDKYEIVFDRTPPGDHVQFDSNRRFTIDVAIESIDVVADQPAVGVINQMLRIVDDVLSETKAECRSLGFVP